MSPDFLKAMKFIFPHENVVRKGVVVSENDPDDRGGLTKYGIDARNHPGINIEELTEQKALDVYYSEWTQAQADKLPWPLSLAYFDATVNLGIQEAGMILQRTVGAVVDGRVGPKTLKAAGDKVGAIGAQKVALDFCEARASVYSQIVKNHPKDKKFYNGWINRLSDLKQAILC